MPLTIFQVNGGFKMLQVGCPKIKLLKEKLDGLDFENIHFEIESILALTIKLKHNANSDQEAKRSLKKYISSIDELKNVYTNIQIIDENGKIL